MPLHDWSRLDSGDFHSFHGTWITFLTSALNNGSLPDGFSAVPDKAISLLGYGPEPKRRDPDVLAVETNAIDQSWSDPALSLDDEEPVATLVHTYENYHERQRMIWVLNPDRQPVAAIEIVSPGNKSTERIADEFAEKCVEYLDGGLNVTLIDIVPKDRQISVPERVAAHLGDGTLNDNGEPLGPLTASYVVSRPREPGSSLVYIAKLQVGDDLPASSLFLDRNHFVKLPLEQTYAEALHALGTGFVERFLDERRLSEKP